MRFPVPQISISVLVLHLVLGCCWHHGHCYETHNSDQADRRDNGTTIVTACRCSETHHSESRSDSSQPHEDPARSGSDHPSGSQPSESYPCDGEPCSYLRSERITAQHTELCVHAFERVGGASHHDELILSMQFFAFDIRPSDAGPPVRRHLMLHILVI